MRVLLEIVCNTGRLQFRLCFSFPLGCTNNHALPLIQDGLQPSYRASDHTLTLYEVGISVLSISTSTLTPAALSGAHQTIQTADKTASAKSLLEFKSGPTRKLSQEQKPPATLEAVGNTPIS